MSSAHLSPLGLDGLSLEHQSASLALVMARGFVPIDGAPDYDERLQALARARTAFRAELERVTGLPAALIKRRLAL